MWIGLAVLVLALTPAQIKGIDRFVAAEMAVTHVPGAAVGVYDRGTIVLAKGYGLANVELNVPVKPQTIFQSGSVGKQFTAAAIMMLVEEGLISLDDSIVKYFPDAPASWKPIRIRNLLSHTSGLSEYATDALAGPGGPFDLRRDYTEDQLVAKIEALPIESAPGEKWVYRNTNYVLLGVIIHRVSGKFYGEFLAERIFRPLGMTSTRIISETDIVPNRAAGYVWNSLALQNQDWVAPSINTTADGSLYFNVLDLAKWDAALSTTELLSQSSLKRMWTVYRLNDGKPNDGQYGFAWRIHAFHGRLVVEHSGAWQGFTCNITRYVDDALTVVVLTNLDSDHSRPDYMARVIAGLADPRLLPQRLAKIDDHQPSIERSLVGVLDAIQSGTPLDARAGAEFNGFTQGDAAQLRRQLAPLWPGGSLTLVARAPSADDSSLLLSQFRLRKGTHAMLVTFGLDAAGKVQSLLFEPDRAYRGFDLYG
ncbi:MAG: beta-lactamase family protein [Candidatus Eremiobacteraeota bacterium]|nr:beta-lactamase family protein [Candidatus Eremiobacteraeota bacterium]